VAFRSIRSWDKKVVERVCTECHGTDEITSIKRTPDQWRRLVKDMLDRRDTKTSEEEVEQILEYLIAHFSRQDGVQAARYNLLEARHRGARRSGAGQRGPASGGVGGSAAAKPPGSTEEKRQ
jgi:hypothetical protein